MIPLILIELVPIAVRMVELALGNGAGSAKKTAVVNILAAIQASRTAALPNSPPPDAAGLDAAIENAVSKLNQTGQLKGPETVLTEDHALDAASYMLRGALMLLDLKRV